MSDTKKIDELINIRINKIEELSKNNVNPYPHNFKVTNTVDKIVEEENLLIESQEEVITAGRIISIRNMGKVLFINIQGEFSKLQCYISNKIIQMENEDYSLYLKNLDIGDFVGISGKMFYTKTEEYSIKAHSIQILSKSIRPLPTLKEKDGDLFNKFEDKELRYRHRYLDFIANPQHKKIFIKRHKIIQSFRSFLDQLNFIEVETPALQPLYGGANARPFTTHHHTLDEKLYMRIAVELYLKRLIIGGFPKVYELGKNFRNEGMDRNHNPEFTMLEFYQSFSDVYDMMDLTEDMLRMVSKAVSASKIDFDGNSIDFSKKFRRVTMNKLMKDEFGIDNIILDDNKILDIAKEMELDIELPPSMLLDKIFSLRIEPKLQDPTFVYDYPKSISPLSKIKRDQTDSIVERFELFIGGMEIANAFTELNDPIDQRNRFLNQEKLKAKGDEEAQVLDEDFLNAIETGMPPTGGVGIGIDRVVMVMTGQKSIKDVILFPAMRKIDI